MATGTVVDVIMPQMGVSVSEGTVTKWLRSEGESIAADEPLLEISTDKVDTEVPSPADGILAQILVQEGETVDVGTRVAVISTGGGGEAPVSEPPPEPASQAVATEPAASADAAPPPAEEVIAAPAEAVGAGEETEIDGRGEGRAFVSPVVARIAAEHGVDVSSIEGTGRGGRVTKKDILAFLESGAAAPAAPVTEPVAPQEREAPPPPKAPAAPRLAGTPLEPGDGEQIEPMSVMRKSIAEHMRHSLETSAPVTTVFEVDMSKVWAIRQRLKGEFEARHGVRLTFLPFIARAAVDTISKWPWINGEIRGDSIVLRSRVNLGIAVALEGGKGLIVPVIRSAEEKNLLGLTRAINDLGERARAKKLSPDEVQGGTFTITNPGGFGAIMGTPIINQPQVAILDVEAIVKRPVVVTDEHGAEAIAIRPMMNLCLTYDHRLIDGAYAAPFMRDLKTSLETWDESSY